MTYNKLRKKRRKQKNEQNAQKGKNGRTGANEAPAMTKTEKELAGGVQGLSKRFVKLKGEVESVQDSVAGANSRLFMTNNRVDQFVSQVNEKLKKIDKGMSEFAQELNLITDTLLDTIDSLIEKDIIDDQSINSDNEAMINDEPINNDETIDKQSMDSDNEAISNDENNESAEHSASKEQSNDELPLDNDNEPINVPSLEEMKKEKENNNVT